MLKKNGTKTLTENIEIYLATILLKCHINNTHSNTGFPISIEIYLIIILSTLSTVESEVFSTRGFISNYH